MRKFLLSVLVAALTASVAQAQTTKEEVKALQQQIADLQARLVKLTIPTTNRYEEYTKGLDQALKQGKPLVTFVGVQKRDIAGTVTCYAPDLPEYAAGDVVVSLPVGDELHWRTTLPAKTTDAQVQAAVAPRAVQALPAPFVQGRDAEGNVPPTVVGEVQDAIKAINGARAQRGLRPYVRDDDLTKGAIRVTAHRAARRMFGHAENDFNFLEGCTAACAGCAANEPTWGFMACAVYENWTYCGAAWVLGGDGRLYCHAFYR